MLPQLLHSPPDFLPLEKMEAVVPEASSPLLDRIIGHGTLPLFLSTVLGALIALFLVYLVRELHRYLSSRAGEGVGGGTEGELEVQYTELPIRRRRGRHSRGAEVEQEEEEEEEEDMEEDIFDELYGYDEELDFDLEDNIDSYSGGRGRATATPTPTHASATPPPPAVAGAAAAAVGLPKVVTLRDEHVDESSSGEVDSSGGVASTQAPERSEDTQGRRKEGGRAKDRLRNKIIEEKWEEEEEDLEP